MSLVSTIQSIQLGQARALIERGAISISLPSVRAVPIPNGLRLESLTDSDALAELVKLGGVGFSRDGLSFSRAGEEFSLLGDIDKVYLDIFREGVSPAVAGFIRRYFPADGVKAENIISGDEGFPAYSTASDFSGEMPGGLPEVINPISIVLNNSGLENLPDDIGEFKRLTTFRAESCSISGELPSSIWDGSIQQLLLSGNAGLEGGLLGIGRSQALKDLRIHGTGIAGPLPSGIGEIKSLTFLSLPAGFDRWQVLDLLEGMEFDAPSSDMHLHLAETTYSGPNRPISDWPNVQARWADIRL